MEDFANQLANLQRAATRASSSNDKTNNGIVNGIGSKRRSSDDGGRNGRRTKKLDDRGYNHDNNDKRRGGGEVYNDDKQRGQNEGPSLRALIEGVAERYNNDIAKMKQTTRKPNKRRRHIALLFLTIDDLPHEHIWREWLSTTSDNDDKEEEDWGVIVSVIVHAKYPHRIKSSWLKQRHLLQQQVSSTTAANAKDKTASPVYHTRKPEWGSVDITKGMMDLLEEGLKIGTPTATTMEDGGRRYLSTTTCQSSKYNNVLLAIAKATASHTKDDDGHGHDNEEIPPVDRFIFVSESCLPVTTLKECELALFGPRHPSSSSHSDNSTITTNNSSSDSASSSSLYDKSWIHARSTPNNGYAKQLQWDAILRHTSKEDDSTTIPSQYIWKSDQWVILTRQHAVAISTLPQTYLNNNTILDTIFTNVRASDEIYIPTVLSILGIIHRPMGVKEVEDYNYDTTTTSISGQKRRRISKEDESRIGNEILRRRSTYCDWSMGAKNPISFSTIQEWKDVVCLARNEGCLFARKFVTPPSSTGGGRKERGGGRAVSQSMLGDDGGLITVEAWKAAIYHYDKNT
jgi:hypothetical protein